MYYEMIYIYEYYSHITKIKFDTCRDLQIFIKKKKSRKSTTTCSQSFMEAEHWFLEAEKGIK